MLKTIFPLLLPTNIHMIITYPLVCSYRPFCKRLPSEIEFLEQLLQSCRHLLSCFLAGLSSCHFEEIPEPCTVYLSLNLNQE